MTPEQQQSALERCLALQPLVGWPQWGKDDKYERLYCCGGELWLASGRDDEGEFHNWRYLSPSGRKLALCIWQDHLLRWLCDSDNPETMQLMQVFYDRHGWAVLTDTCTAVSHKTLMEALLDVCEQIQKEKGTDAKQRTT